MEFEGKRVLVTGGTRGVGRSIVEEFLKAGARVAINGTSGASVDKALAQLGGSGKVVPAPGDLGTTEGCRRTVDATLDGLGGIDVLVNNAGVNRDGPLLDMSEDDWDQVLNVNLKSPMLLIQLAGKAMIEGTGGQIVNIAAVTGVQARANAGATHGRAAGGRGAGVVSGLRKVRVHHRPDDHLRRRARHALTHRGVGSAQFEGCDGEDLLQRQCRRRAAVHTRRLEDRLQAMALRQSDGRPIGLRRVDEDHLAGALVDQGAKQQIGAGFVLGEKRADLVAIPAGAQHAVAGDIAVA